MSKFKKNLALILAATLVVGLCFVTFSSELKADENDLEAVVVAQESDYVTESSKETLTSEPVKAVEEIIIELPPESEEADFVIPEEETDADLPEDNSEETDAEKVESEADKAEDENDSAEEDVSAEEEFDVVKAYRHYISLNETEREAYLNSLSEENRQALLAYIALMETTEDEEETEKAAAEAEEETEEEFDYSKLKFSFTSDCKGKMVEAGTPVTLTAHLEGFEELEYTCFWEYTTDGTNFNVAGSGETFTYSASEENADWLWRLSIELAD